MAAVPAPYLRKALEGAEDYPAEAEPQTAGITTAILLSYVESRGGRAAVQRVLELSGLLGRESELRDESTWWTYIQKQALMEAVTHVLEDPQATRRAGAYALETGVGSTLKAALRAFGSPELAYTNVARSNHKFSRNSRMDVLMVGNGYATLSHHQVVDVRNTKVDCLYNQGLLGVLPELFGLPPARVTHTQCALDGADSCIYDVRWEQRSRMVRWSPSVTAAGVLVGGAGAATALAPAERVGRGAGAGRRGGVGRLDHSRGPAAADRPGVRAGQPGAIGRIAAQLAESAGRGAGPGQADDLDRRWRAQGRGRRRRGAGSWRRTARWRCSAPAASAPRPSGR